MSARQQTTILAVASLLLASACGSANTGDTAGGQDSRPLPELQDPIMPDSSPSSPSSLADAGPAADSSNATNPNDQTKPTMEHGKSPEVKPEPGAVAEPSRSVRVTIKGFRNTKGQALVSLFAGSKGFPDNGNVAATRKAYRIVGSEIKIKFADVEPGTYAIAVLHDEDKDFKMKTGLMGIPKEGYGVSNNAKGRFGPPKFSDAKFTISDKKDVKLTITMIYH